MQCFDESCQLHCNPRDESDAYVIDPQKYYRYRVLPSLPTTSRRTRQREPLRYQETTSLILSRSTSTPNCWTSEAAIETYSCVDQIAVDYDTVSNDRSAAPPLQAASHSSSDIYGNAETPVSRSSASFRSQSYSQYAALNFQRREGTPSSVGTNYIRDFNFVNNP